MAHQVGAFLNVPKSTGQVSDSRPVRVTTIHSDTVHMAMKNLGLDLFDKSPNDMTPDQAHEARKQRIKRCIESLIHASGCENQSCAQPSCVKIKRVLAHQKVCINVECQICKQFFALCCYHAKDCNGDQCVVPFCSNVQPKLIIKKKIPTENVTCIPKRMHNTSFMPIYSGPVTNNVPFPRMFNNTAPMATAFQRPSMFAPIRAMQAQFGPRRPPPAVFRGLKPYSVISDFDQFVQQQPQVYYITHRDNQRTNGLNNATSKEWRTNITPDHRQHLIYKLMQVFFPMSDPISMHDQPKLNMIAYIQKCEEDIFEKANSSSEYYRLLAEKVDKFQKAYEKKRQERKANLNQSANNKTGDETLKDRLVSKL